MSGPAAPLLLGDIGGTNARFALVEGGAEREAEKGAEKRRLWPLAKLKVRAYPTPEDAIAHFLQRSKLPRPPRRAVFAVAGPVEGESVTLTNGAWTLSAESLRERFALESIELVNDFAAVAASVPGLGGEDVLKIGGGRAVEGAPVAVLGPGTGLGVAGCLPGQGPARVLVTEGGHVTMPATNDAETALLAALRTRFGHVSAERLLSGSGLEILYETLCAEGNGSPERLTAAEITSRAIEDTCPACRQALDLFCAMLGTVAGNLALTLGARGGVYIAGGILPRLPRYFAASQFRARFEAKGRFESYLQRIPTSLIVHPHAAFLGLLELAAMRASVRADRD